MPSKSGENGRAVLGILPLRIVMNAVTVAKLKYILPSLRTLNSEALLRELDMLSVYSCSFASFLVRSRCDGVLQNPGLMSM